MGTAGSTSNLTVQEDSGTTGLGLSALAYSVGGGADESGQTLSYTVTAVPLASLGQIVTDKNSWALGGGLAATQTPEGFMRGAAKKIAAECAKLRK